MYHKAITFNDNDTAEKILSKSECSPAEYKKLGGHISNFNSSTWNDLSVDISYRGNMLKFEQNSLLRETLLSTGDKLIVEASPYDKIWGIGFDHNSADGNRDKWGTNLLGQILMRVRNDLGSSNMAMTVADSSEKSGNITWRYDVKWEKPMVKSKGRQRYDDVDKYLYHQGLLCRIHGGEYIFVDTANYWCNLASDEAVSRINAMIDIMNATVNYEKSFKPFIKYIIKRCNANVGAPIPTSVCIGTERLEIELDENSNTITFNECRALLKVAANVDRIVAGVCIMPIDITLIPSSYMFPGKGEILNYIIKIFPDMRDLITIMWHIGNCVVDPISRPKSVMLLGPGGSGKSTLLQIMFSSLIGCCGIIPDGALTGRSSSMSQTVSEVVASFRMAVCYEVGLEKDKLNMSVFKNISGSDYIRVGYNSCKSNCSLTLASNGIIDLERQPDYLEDAIMRRVVCVLMNVNAMEIKTSYPPEDIESRLDFICACIYIRLRYEFMPVSPMSLLLTMCASKIDKALEHIKETTEPINVFDGSLVLDVLAGILRLSKADIILKAKLISPLCTIDVDGHTLLRGLCPR